MKLRVDRDQLADAAAWVAKNLPNRPSVPMLAGVKLTADAGTLTVEGFDYEVSTRVAADATIDAGGAALVSGRLLAEITKALPRKPVDLAAAGTHLELVCGSARFTLPTMPVEDYPTLPDMPETAGSLNAAQFATAVTQVAVAAGRDEALPMMTGVRIEIADGTLTMMATDRYRLAYRDIPWPNPHTNTKILVPASTLHDTTKTLAAAGGDIAIALADNSRAGEGLIGLSSGARRATSRLLDGANYPPLRSLFPTSHNAEAHIQVTALVEVVKRVALVAERTTPVLLSFSPDGLVVEAGGTENAKASEAMGAAFTGDPLTIGFNPQYLIDGLQNLGTTHARIAIVDAFKPAVITPAEDDGEPVPGYRYLIMPIRVTR